MKGRLFMINDEELEKLEKNIKNVIKTLGELKEDIQNKAEEDEEDFDFEIRATREGILLDGNLSDLLYGLSGICSSIMDSKPDDVPEDSLKRVILKTVKIGLEHDLVEHDS